MKTILVPTDFSDNAKNAADYAVQFAIALSYTKIVLLNCYEVMPILSENTFPIMPVMEMDTLAEVSTTNMKQFAARIQQTLPANVTLEQRSAFGNVASNIETVCSEMAIDLIVMGISGTSKLEEMLIGSTATSVIKHIQKPVIIVPGGLKYKPIRQVMFACDYKNVMETIPVKTMEALVSALGAAVHVVNVYEDAADITANKTYQHQLLSGLLSNMNPTFHFISNPHFMDGINTFVEQHAIDLIITIPKKHGFFHNIFAEKHTKQLAFHGGTPLLCMHE